MPLEPKFQRRRGGESLPRTFVDREELLASFQAALDRPDRSRPRTVVFYGLGGIGKSRLKREIRDRVSEDDRGTLWAEVDFSLPTLRDPQTALFSLRRQLNDRHHVRFPTFDLVYAYLWKLARPNIAPLEEGRALFQAGSMDASLPSSAGVPFVSFVAQAVEKGSKPAKAWWIKRGRDDLQELSHLEPAEIEERLPAYLAEDLAEYLEEEQLSAVICFDTYEALFADVRSEEQRLLRDEWLRELILQLPSVLFVISGREKLDWEELDPDWGMVLEQNEMQELPEEYARAFLTAASLTDPELQALILKETGNLPFLLDLVLDTVEEMKRAGREIGREDLTGWDSAVEFRMAERFLRYLSPSEQDTVEVLAIPRLFDEQLFRDLCTGFETQFPLGQFREIRRFSFMLERSPGAFQMHEIMAESLRARLRKRDPERLKALHSFLFHRFDQKLEGMGPESVDPDQEQAFLEALFHAEQALTLEDTVDWFVGRIEVFREAGRDRPLLNAARTLAADARRVLGPHHPRTVQSFSCLGGLNLPDANEGESVLRQALEAARSAGRPAEDLIPRILTNLARTLFFRQNRFEEAKRLLREALALLEESPTHNEPDYCFAAASLSACLSDDGDLRGARDVCRQAISWRTTTRASSICGF